MFGNARMECAAARHLLVWSCACVGILDAQAPATPGPEPRVVFALSGTKQEDRNSPRLDAVHELLQMPLNHLGLVVRQHDLREGEPTDLDPAVVRGLVTYFHGEEERPAWLWDWLERQADRGVRVVHFGDLGPLLPEVAETEPRLARWLARFGLRWDDEFLSNPLRIDVEFARPAESCYESRQVYARIHRGPWSVSDANRIWVSTVDRTDPDDRRTPVVTGPWGGLALDPWAVRVGTEHQDRRWYLDPFAFFAEALGTRGLPAPDPSVLNGRRMFVLHVDGDGFESVSTTRPGAVCGEVLLEEVVDRYALPMTVSVIVAGLTRDYAIEEPTPAMRVAREILGRPWVEPASHAVLHPLNWRRRLTPRSPPRVVNWYSDLENYRHDMVKEVSESIRFIDERLLSEGRRCRVMLWSGAANPDEGPLRAAERAGCWNLNGGVYRWDAMSDSVGFVSPWGKQVGETFQVYCGAANENVFEGFFHTMPGAFAHIDRTIENAGRRRILKPANLYLHFYSAENPARLAALRQLIERWAFAEPTAPVFASTYASAVHSAQTGCRISATPTGWRFEGFDHCRTVRIDGEERAIDWARSRGLLGGRRAGGALYLSLSAAEAEVVWAPRPKPAPHVEQANHVLADVERDAEGVSLVSGAFSRRVIVFAGLPPSGELRLVLDGAPRRVRSDPQGRFELTLPKPGTTKVELRLR